MFSIMASTSASVTLAAGFSMARSCGGLTLISGSTSKCAAYFRSVSGPSVIGSMRGAQFLLGHRLDERAAHEIAHDLGAHLLAELLGDHRQWRLARPEALQTRG